MTRWKLWLSLVIVIGLAGGLPTSRAAQAQEKSKGNPEIAAAPIPQHPWFAPRAGEHTTLVVAHQGGEGIRPANTMVAFQHAQALGADVLDMDMHISKDGVLVLMHNETVNETTNGTGAIRDLTLAQLKALDAGYRFSPDGGLTFPYRGQGVKIATLEEVFQAFPGKRLGVEIKQTPSTVATPFCSLIRRYGMQNNVLVSSFDGGNMDVFRKACPEIATSATTGEFSYFLFLHNLGMTGSLNPKYHVLQIPEYSAGVRVLTPKVINNARNRGLAVIPWTFNTTTDLQRILALGVEGINTDYPDRMLALNP